MNSELGNREKKTNLYLILCVVVAAAASLPVACGYIMTGGIVTEWIARVEEIGVGSFRLYPSNETLLSVGITQNVMDSNLFHLLAGLVRRWSGSAVLAYRMNMLLLQICTMIFSCLFFGRYFDVSAVRENAEESAKSAAFIGSLLYMTCPYRLYVCYDLADFSQAYAWMLLPLYAWAMVGLCRGRVRATDLFVAAAALAGIGYADAILFISVAGITLLAAVLLGKFWMLAPLPVSVLLFSPGLYRLGRYLFQNGLEELNLPLDSIMGGGYRLGQFLNCYVFREGHPGMGLGMLSCLALGLWFGFVGEQKGNCSRSRSLFAVLALFLAAISLRYFPWDLAQRLGIWALRLVALIRTPAIYGGLAYACLCVTASLLMRNIVKRGERRLAGVILLTVLVFCLGICVYQCNTLTFDRYPMDIQ